MKFFIGILYVLLMITAQATENTCAPAKTGNPCAGSLRTPRVNLGAGNPIHLMSGNKFQQENDLLMRLSGLEFTRYYNSSSALHQTSGAGWTTSYSTRLYPLDRHWQILLDDGQRISFYPPENNKARAHLASHGYLEKQGDNEWVWYSPEKIIRHFNPQGLMTTLNIPGFSTIHIHHKTINNVPVIARVFNQEEELRFHYILHDDHILLEKLDTPVGEIHYHYDIKDNVVRLNQVDFPSKWSRLYHYETEFQSGKNHRLTGISLSNPQQQTVRTHEWHYQADGKANYSRSLFPTEHTLSIHYEKEAQQENDKSMTKVSDENGHETRIEGTIKAGQYLLENVSGKGCYLCPSVGTKARYDDKGQLIEINGFHIERDAQGKTQKISFTHPFWGDVALYYDKDGQVYQWSSPYTGLQARRFIKNQVYALEEPQDPSSFTSFNGHELVFQNNLVLKQLKKDKHLHALILEKEGSPIWTQTRLYNEKGLLASESFDFQTKKIRIEQHYLYDDQKRLVGAHQTLSPSGKENIFYYAWNANGSNKKSALNQKTLPLFIQRNAQGFPTKINERTLRYGKEGRLIEVRENNKWIANYRYDEYGRRLEKKTANAHVQFRYKGNQLSTELIKTADASIHRHYFYRGVMPIAFTEKRLKKGITQSEETFFIHNDHLGQPFLVTDKNQAIRWMAYYTPTGKAELLEGDIHFNLRQAGQYFDEETQWHDNYLRTYDPTFGHYLEPDPLGPMEGNDPYGYVNQQPRHFIDPLGLVLFAFDGTTNNIDSNTNVWKFYQLYDGPKFYKEGPGGIPGESKTDRNGGIFYGTTSRLIFNEQRQNLLRYLATKHNVFDEVTPIDIVGFSRGAMIAMMLSNYIKGFVKDGLFEYQEEYSQDGVMHTREIRTCVDLRFIGLFDTVAQLGINGVYNDRVDYTAAPDWALITHAVALNEYRSLLPLTIYEGADNVIEQGFLGNHSDVGGVFVPGDATDPFNPHPHKLFGDLSHIPLAWTYTKAQELGVPLRSLDKVIDKTSNLAEIKNPIMHNTYGEYNSKATELSHVYRVNYDFDKPPLHPNDRTLQRPSSNVDIQEQAEHPNIGKLARLEHQAAADVKFLDLYGETLHQGQVRVFGHLNAEKYLHWLEEKLDWQAPLKVIPSQ